MQAITSQNISTQSPSILTNPTSVRAQEQRLKVSATEENQSQKSSQDARAQQRLDIDEQAIALVEREQFNTLANSSNFQPNANTSNSRYDEPPARNQSAVAAYQSVDTIAQRENVQQVFGVDLFA